MGSALEAVFGGAPDPTVQPKPAPKPQSALDAVFGATPTAPAPTPGSPVLTPPGAVQTSEPLNRPGEVRHDPITHAIVGIAEAALSIGDIGAGTVRYLGRSVARGGPVNPLAFVPQNAEESADAQKAQMGLALGASAVMAGVAAPIMAGALPATAFAGEMMPAVTAALGHIVRSLGVSELAGATFGALRPTTPDESRMQSVQDGVLGFAAIDMAMQTALLGGTAIAGRFAKPSLAHLGSTITPKGVGPISAAPNLLAEDLTKAGIEPGRALDIALGRTTLNDAVQAQHALPLRAAGSDDAALKAVQAKMAAMQEAGAQAAGLRGYSWIADGRPLADYPHAPGERFYARPINKPLTPEEMPDFMVPAPSVPYRGTWCV